MSFELKAIEQRRRTLQATLENQTQQLRRLGDPEAQHRQLRAEWCELQRDRTAAIKQQCEDLTELSDGMIRASVGGVVVAVRQLEALKAALQGSGVRGNKQERLLDEISRHDDPLVAWHTTLDELETRVLAEGNPGAPLPTSTVALGILGANDIHRAAPKLTANTILNLSLIAPDDHPVFEYRAKEGEYIAFKDASAGQQATALLRVLLKQGGPPLVIDQPEDDLDSQVIQDVVRRVWDAKG